MELIESRVYTREQVADILQVSIASVDRYIKENRLPAATWATDEPSESQAKTLQPL